MSDAPVDGIDRPLEPRRLLVAYAAALEGAGFFPNDTTLNLLAFWDEALCPILGERPRSVGFERVLGLPRSAALTREVAAWRDEPDGLRIAVDQPEASGRERLSDFHAATGAIALEGPWGETLVGFLQGFRAGLGSGGAFVGWSDETDDFRKMMSVDPCFANDPWSECGPSRVDLDMGRCYEALAGRRGNSTEASMLAWTNAAQAGGLDVGPPMAAMAYGMLLAQAAGDRYERFGDMAYLALVERVKVVERTRSETGRRVVTARVMDGDLLVGRVEYEDRVKVTETFGRAGAVTRKEDPDGTLLLLDVPTSIRGKGYGTLCLRYAMAKGCVRSVPPPDAAKSLFSRHGRRRLDGGFDLSEAVWPTPAASS